MKSDNKHPERKNRNRRSTLKTLMVGGGTFTLSALPSQWVKPVVDAVTLPAHAQTTGPAAAPNGFSVQTQVTGLLDRIIPKAHASFPLPPDDATLCIESDGTGWTASFDIGSDVLTGNGEIGNCGVLGGCGPFAFDLQVVEANNDGSFDFALYEPDSCPGGFPLIDGTTNVPCSLGSCLDGP